MGGASGKKRATESPIRRDSRHKIIGRLNLRRPTVIGRSIFHFDSIPLYCTISDKRTQEISYQKNDNFVIYCRGIADRY